jgi:hypothetical protein
MPTSTIPTSVLNRKLSVAASRAEPGELGSAVAVAQRFSSSDSPLQNEKTNRV